MSERNSKETPCQRAMVKDDFCYGFRRGRQTFFDVFRRWFFYGFRRGRKRFSMVSVVGLLMVPGCYRTAAASPMETVNKKTPGRFRDELSMYIYIYIYIYKTITTANYVCIIKLIESYRAAAPARKRAAIRVAQETEK